MDNAIEEAVKYTADNIAGFGENTRIAILADVSGSMFTTLSQKNSVDLYDLGFLLSMLLKHRCKNVITRIFGDTWKQLEFPSSDILANTLDMRWPYWRASTNGYEVLNSLCDEGVEVDKVMMFTDMQMWDSRFENNTLQKSWNRYKQMAPKAKLYLFDLAGYGKSPISMVDNDVFLIAGWSDKVFDVLEAPDKGSNVNQEIEKINI